MSSTNDDPMIGRQIDGHYEVLRLIGKGGMAYVYEALDTEDEPLALKIITLHHDRASELSKRFEREVRISKKLTSHENVIKVYRDGRVDNDKYYIAMELIRGETLTQRLKRIKRNNDYISYEELVNIMQQVASALDYIHSKSVIHRDIKPSNIMIEKDTERVVLMDFGLVMEDTANNTTMGTAFGTPRYIAPEQAISSQQAKPASDIYALGIIIYEMLTGQTPFDEDSAMSMALSHITNDPPPLQQFRDDIPKEVSDVVLKALSKQPEDRYPSATDFINALVAAINTSLSIEISPFAIKDPAFLAEDGDTFKPNGEESHQVFNAGALTPSSEESPLASQEISIQSSSSKMSPMVMGGMAVVGLIVIAVLGFVLFGGGSSSTNSDDSSIPAGGIDITLTYSNGGLVLFNANSNDFALNSLRLLASNGTYVFDFGTSGIPTSSLSTQTCFVIRISTSFTPPTFCEPDPTIINPSRPQQTDANWVWDTSQMGAIEQFQVEYNGSIISECLIADGTCTISIAG